MPNLFALRDRTDDDIVRELSAIMDTVVLNDVARRLKLCDIALLQRLISYLFSTSGNLFSTNRVVGALNSARRKTSSETVDNYIDALKKAYLVDEAPRTGLQGRELLSPLRKFYPVDTGLRNLATGFSVENMGLQLETVVYSELVRRGYTVTIGSLRVGEIDFVANRTDERLYIQVSETVLDPAARERELKPLRTLSDSFPKMLLTLDRLGTGTTDDGIRIANVIDWLLGQGDQGAR